MLNRRYALLGWAVWRVTMVMAKRRAKGMAPTEGRSRSVRLVAVVPALLAAGAAVWLFLRHRESEPDLAPNEWEPDGAPNDGEPVG